MKANSKNKFGFHRGSFGIQQIIATIFSIIELILAFRFILKLLGANATNNIVQGFYDVTQPCVGLFEGIFKTMNTNIAGIHGVFEPATVIAVVVIGLIQWAIFKLFFRQSGSRYNRVV